MSEALGDEQWFIIPCPAGVELTFVAKERGTHGSIYCLWECEKKTPCFLGQSIPQLVKCINDKVVLAPEKRLHASSLYRCLRREARKESHKNWKVERFSRADVAELNAFLAEFPSIVVTSKSPELWHCVANAADEERDETAGDVGGDVVESRLAGEREDGARADGDCGDDPDVGDPDCDCDGDSVTSSDAA